MSFKIMFMLIDIVDREVDLSENSALVFVPNVPSGIISDVMLTGFLSNPSLPVSCHYRTVSLYNFL